MTVGSFCNRETVIARPDESVPELAKKMRRHHVGDIIIVDDHDPERVVPLGIVTDRDLVVEILANEVAPDLLTGGEIMSNDLLTAGEGDSLWLTLQRMHSHGVHRLVVVDDRGGLAGILSVDDLIELLADELSTLARIPRRSQERERQRRE